MARSKSDVGLALFGLVAGALWVSPSTASADTATAQPATPNAIFVTPSNAPTYSEGLANNELRARYVDVSSGPLVAALRQTNVMMPLFDSETATFTSQRADSSRPFAGSPSAPVPGPQVTSWSGVDRAGNGSATVTALVDDAGKVTVAGVITRGSRKFVIGNSPSGKPRLTEIDTQSSGGAPDAPPLTPAQSVATSAPAGTVSAASVSSPAPNIDVVVAWANGVANGQALVNQAINETNAAFANTRGMAEHVNLLASFGVNYNQDLGGIPLDLQALKTSNANDLPALRAWRSKGADLVALFVPVARGNVNGVCCASGQADIPPVGGDTAAAYSVTAANDVTNGHFTFSHEVGHNLGGGHNPEDGNGPYPYSHGHFVQGVGATVMAYDTNANCPAGHRCPRQDQFSDPGRGFLNNANVVSGIANQRDNRTSLLNLAPFVANYVQPNIAFHANTNTLWRYRDSVGGSDQMINVRAGTSPSTAALATGGTETAYQDTLGFLRLTGTAGNVNTGQGMLLNTSPSITALPNGGYVVAFQANLGLLYTYASSGGTSATTQAMKVGTSPSIAAVPAGGWFAAFQSVGGFLTIFAGGGASPNYAPGLGMAAGTSPSIAPSGTNSFKAAFQANSNILWTFAPGTPVNTAQGMKPGTSPSIAAVSSGHEMAFQALGTTNLVVFGSAANINTGLGMASGTSPSITALGNGYHVAFQANNTDLYLYATEGPVGDTGLGMKAGTSPSDAFSN